MALKQASLFQNSGQAAEGHRRFDWPADQQGNLNSIQVKAFTKDWLCIYKNNYAYGLKIGCTEQISKQVSIETVPVLMLVKIIWSTFKLNSKYSDKLTHKTKRNYLIYKQTVKTQIRCYTICLIKKDLSHDGVSESDIMQCNKIDKPLVVYKFTGNAMTPILMLPKIRETLNVFTPKLQFLRFFNSMW